MKRIDRFSKNQLEGSFLLMTGLLMTGLFDFLSYAIGISRTHWRLSTADQRADQRHRSWASEPRTSRRQPHLGLALAMFALATITLLKKILGAALQHPLLTGARRSMSIHEPLTGSRKRTLVTFELIGVSR